jgi:hypothetical protein
MHENSDALGGRRAGDFARAEHMHRLEILPALLALDARQIDRSVGADQRRGDRGGIAQVGLDRMDLADIAERLQEAGKIRPANGDADAPAAPRQRAHDIAPDETRAAENCDEALADIGGFGHERSSPRTFFEGVF